MSFNPLRRLSLLSEHPTASTSLSPAISDTSLFLQSSVRLNKIKDVHYGAWKIINTFFEQLSHDGQINLASDILNSRDDDDKLVQLVNHLLDAVLKPFLLAGGHAPQPLATPPSGDAPYAIDVSMSTIESSTRAEQTKLRNDCLIRDGYQCTYTGKWDLKSCMDGAVQPSPRSTASYLECAHIIPFALGSFDEKDPVQTRNKAIIWFSMHRYLIDARSINQRGNALMLDLVVHRHFSECLLGFQPQGMNQYKAVSTIDVDLGIRSKSSTDVVEFFCSDASIAMPEPAFLQVSLYHLPDSPSERVWPDNPQSF